MRLPQTAQICMERLEQAGYACYAVGGCVRDELLGLEPHDFDLCSAAKPAEVRRIFADLPLVLAGEKHGTVGVVLQGQVVEITTFRRESGYADGRHPDQVDFVGDIRQDLARRDFTVNAMAWSPSRGFADPFGGREDLKNRRLRCVGDPQARFEEDALRILRGLRFSLGYGLTPEPETEAAMISCAPLMDRLARERVLDELCKLLPQATAAGLLRFAPVLCQVIPELRPTVGFDQKNPHHDTDLYTHLCRTVERVPAEPALRWAALLHDVGKPDTFSLDEQGVGHFYGHAQRSAQMAEEILLRLKAPTELRQRVVFLIRHHMDTVKAERKLLRRLLSRYGHDALMELLALQNGDFPRDQGEIFNIIQEIQEENACLSLRDLAVNGRDLLALGYAGPAVGRALELLLEQVVDERLPNRRAELIQFLQEHSMDKGELL